jgi:hypothetical protein
VEPASARNSAMAMAMAMAMGTPTVMVMATDWVTDSA